MNYATATLCARHF